MHIVTRFAWPVAFVAVAAIGYATVDRVIARVTPVPASVVEVAHPTPTVLKELRNLARLETLSLHVEKVIDVRDHQKRLYGLVDADDSLLFVATGEVVLGVDFGKLRDGDATYDAATKTAYMDLPSVEVLSSRFDEAHSYVHARKTDILAQRNESLEATARRDALTAFEGTAREPEPYARAKEQAERQLHTLASAWGAEQVVITWREPSDRLRAPSL